MNIQDVTTREKKEITVYCHFTSAYFTYETDGETRHSVVAVSILGISLSKLSLASATAVPFSSSTFLE